MSNAASKKKPLEVGERVKVYGAPTISMILRGTIVRISHDGMLRVQNEAANENIHLCHPKQCRRLVKKPRREWWLNIYSDGEVGGTYSTKERADNGAGKSRANCIHVREVRKAKL